MLEESMKKQGDFGFWVKEKSQRKMERNLSINRKNLRKCWEKGGLDGRSGRNGKGVQGGKEGAVVEKIRRERARTSQGNLPKPMLEKGMPLRNLGRAEKGNHSKKK